MIRQDPEQLKYDQGGQDRTLQGTMKGITITPYLLGLVALMASACCRAAAAPVAPAADCPQQSPPVSEQDSQGTATPDCSSETSTLAIESCFGAALKKRELELSQLLEELSNAAVEREVPDAKTALQDSQEAWERYRSAHCELPVQFAGGGSLSRLSRVQCLDAAASARVEALKALRSDLVEP